MNLSFLIFTCLVLFYGGFYLPFSPLFYWVCFTGAIITIAKVAIAVAKRINRWLNESSK